MSVRRLPLLLLVVLLAACGTAAPEASPDPTPAATPTPDAPTPTPEPTEATETTEDRLDDVGEMALVGPDGERVTFEVEIAADPATRQRGLMERTELADDAGMLFLFPADTDGGFWMKNTLIPLQIAYIAADGEIVDILEMEPCRADPCPSYTPDSAYRSALEVNAGALDDAGVAPGWVAELPEDLPEAH